MPKEKDLVKNALLQAMEKEGCPLCALIEKRSRERSGTILRESVLDTEFRSDFLDSEGFCGFHAQRVMESDRPLPHAILYKSLLQYIRNHIGKKKKKKPCMLCELENRNEKAYQRFFAECLEEEAFLQTYQKESVLCSIHLDGVLAHLKKRSVEREELIAATQQKYDRLFDELEGIKRKSDHKHAHETWTKEERTAWKRVVPLVSDQGAHRRKKR